MTQPKTTENQRPPCVLIAEDDQALRELLAFALHRAGFSVASCNNGLRLLEMLENGIDDASTAADIVITDLRMPALTGLEVLEALFERPGRPPVICMTAFGDPKTHQAAIRFGATHTIDKPFDIDEMIELVRAVHNYQNREKE
ncbi:response regulator [Geopsychrobacter electrodiphilus]|uniref:response regulator n=1 Tax=Geopsychrobacter electrodiphilus TaxID=225196 RepID=UPI00036A327B|nr:response regulator [Geopsychrobacter electrodiphilus]